MTYLLNTCRKATAVLGSVFGNFDGTGEYHHLVLNCVNRLEIWELKVSDLEKGRDTPQIYFEKDGPPMVLLSDLPINGTVKHLLAVPIPVARANKYPRLCLFIVTEKQDVCIIGLNRAKSHQGGPSELIPETLYATNVASSLFHRHFGQTSICVSSHPISTHYGSAASSNGASFGINCAAEEDVAPIVALSQIRSYVILFDIAACIVEGAAIACNKRSKVSTTAGDGGRKRGRNEERSMPTEISQRSSGGLASNNNEDDTATINVDVISQSTATTAIANVPPRPSTAAADLVPPTITLQPPQIEPDEPTDAEVSLQLQACRLFSMSYISSLVKKRACLPFSYCPIMEAEPRSICLQRSATHGRSLAVLFQDPRGRTHVRRYTVTEQPLNNFHSHGAEQVTTGGTTGHTMLQQRQIPILAPIFDRTVLRLVNKSVGLVLTKGITLQNDVESDAMYLHVMPNGVLIIGSILVTYIDTEGRGAKGHVTTTLTPNPHARSEPVAVQSVSPISCVVGYINGALVVCSLDDGERGEIGCHLLAPESTPMTGLSTIGDWLFSSSAYSHSMFVNRNTGACSIAIPNTGPVVEMNVLEGGGSQPSTSVVAATGVEHFTSLQVIREAIPLNEEAVIDGLHGLMALHAVTSMSLASEQAPAGSAQFGVLAISFSTETRMMLFEDGPTLSLEEVDFACSEPTLCLGRVAPSAIVHATGSGAQLLHVTPTAVQQSGQRVVFPSHANLATTDPQCSTLLIVSGRDVSIYELPSLQCLHTLTFPNQVASIEMTSEYEVLVGLWDCNKIQMFTAEDLRPFDLVEGLPMLPRSLKLSSFVKSHFMSEASATPERAAMTDRHLYVGFIDGSIGIIPITSEKQQSAMAGKLQHLALGSQPVSVQIVLNHNRLPSGVLCTGDVPGMLFASGASEVTSSGFGARPLDCVAQLTATTFATFDATEGKLIISSLDTKIQHRVNAIGHAVRLTVPKLKIIPKWNNLLLAAQREAHQDSIVPYYVSGGVVKKSSRVTAPLALLESERCEFIEWFEFNGAPFIVSDGEVPTSCCVEQVTGVASASMSAYLSNKADWDPAQPFCSVIIGTNFSYPNEDIPRNGRFILVAMERLNNKMTMVQLAERDVRGMVLSACMVPRTNNRILVGVTGCVHMYRWSPADKSFVFEVSASFGAAVTKLIPLAGSSLGAAKAKPLPPQIVAATPSARAHARPQSQTSQRTLGGFSTATSNPSSPTADESPIEETETSSLVLCSDIRNSLAIIALNPVELMRIEANERTQREVLEVVPAGNKAFVDKQSGSRVYDPHFITSDTNLNLFIISAKKEKKPTTERGSIYELQGQVPQLGVCGQIHIGDRITVIQRGTLQATKKMKSQPTKGRNAPAPTDALDRASASAAMNNVASTNRWRMASRLEDLSTRFAPPSTAAKPEGEAAGLQPKQDAPPVSEGIRDTNMPSFIYGTVHGAIGSITPLNPLAFNYLAILQRTIVKCLKPIGNLSYDSFKRIYNRETSVYTSSTPHFAEGRDAANAVFHRKSKCYNFIDGDILAQFSANSSLTTIAKGQAVHMINKAIRAAAFTGELFGGTAVDAKRLGLSSNSSSAPMGTESGPTNPPIQPPPPSAPATPVVQPQHIDPNAEPQESRRAVDEDAVAKRSTFTPNEIEHLNELFGVAELPDYPLTIESCDRFLSDVQRFS